MNPREGQFALGGTLRGWVELEQPSPRQVRLLRRCYAGREPRVWSRYGEGQLGSALPWRTTVVKDPFALLSLPCIISLTGARVVVVYRPAGAVLASYRRMGWRADTEELRKLPGAPAAEWPVDDVAAMAEFWNHLHGRFLDRLDRSPGVVVLSHEELARSGRAGMDALRQRCGLLTGGRPPQATRSPRRTSARPRQGAGRPRLHDFDRTAAQVSSDWRERLDLNELERLEQATAGVWRRLESVRTVLTP